MKDLIEQVPSVEKQSTASEAVSAMHSEIYSSLNCVPSSQNTLDRVPSELTFSDPFKKSESSNVSHGQEHSVDLEKIQGRGNGPVAHVGNDHRHGSDASGAKIEWNPSADEMSKMRERWNQVIIMPNGEKAHIK